MHLFKLILTLSHVGALSAVRPPQAQRGSGLPGEDGGGMELLRENARRGSWEAVEMERLSFDALKRKDLEGEDKRKQVCAECMAKVLKVELELLPRQVIVKQYPDRALTYFSSTFASLGWETLLRWYWGQGKTYREIPTTMLAERCSTMMMVGGIDCRADDFDADLRHIYDPRRKIVVPREDMPRTYADQSGDEAVGNSGVSRLELNQEASSSRTPDWLDRFGGAINRVVRTHSLPLPVGGGFTGGIPLPL
ncbi:MAG: hypothetical protein M1816_000769 [Peltula sp. TS41687]|nr:MAG: hypothetical protein M1816_000769 [Peltula sp. TS41687]